MPNKNLIKKLSLTSIYSDTVVDLIFALGGMSCIESVDNCMSRLRITVSSQPTTEDKDFLALGALGIIRSPNQVHLIYGAKSVALKEAFTHLLEIYKNPRILSLIASLGGVDNISEVSTKNDEIDIRLNAPPHSNSPLDTSWTRNGLSVTINSQKIIEPISAIEIQYTIIFWNFLISNVIYDAICSLNIQKISVCRSRLRIGISTKQDPKISFPFLYIKPTPFDSNDQELQIPLLSSRGEDYVVLLHRLLK